MNTPQRIMPLLARDAFDVLFLTIAASSLEDAEHIRLIRERFCEAGLPILLITEPAAAQVRNLALTYGANDCLNKP
ncbi:MAG: hypothetical protein KDJ31_10215 [Candidatus Competibacteraceae bacterium]|nr:hypothetical protein [Candidatus Competibacteraceae bacterium]HRY14643.1 hypothetical protein [Candidatus Competibacteraceae bacterium]